ncbi:monothiol glutaredoxin, Grx4 family [Dictyocaulus viviparus]|uniref:Monothiol glutaredoxin, Grx4 family n=1 Tax=Dictyocaulus viviparus TaxID=29172 RepID=A0A0D8YC08_DICVI|nr:monothiol glutaredoxin, Grx4 family [Dictyocaulus viviparus]
MNVIQLRSLEEFKDFISKWRLAIVHFYASWAAPCEQVNKVLDDLKEDYKSYPIGMCFIDAEEVPDVSAMCSITAAPTLLYFKDGAEVDRVNGYKPEEFESKLIQHSFDIATSQPKKIVSDESKKIEKEDLNTRLKKLIESHRLMLFMKGTPDNPKCGFSKQMIELLDETGASLVSFDILEDEEVRQGLKTYSNWPTYPQLYLDGELIGGLDVFREELQDSEFVSKLPLKQEHELKARLKSLINSHKLMLFMKGDRQQPSCKFSRQIVDLLDGVGADYSTFDVLKDEKVREGLKSFSNWPTFPQLYLNGELLGGLDVVKEEMSDESFVSLLPKK